MTRSAAGVVEDRRASAARERSRIPREGTRDPLRWVPIAPSCGLAPNMLFLLHHLTVAQADDPVRFLEHGRVVGNHDHGARTSIGVQHLYDVYTVGVVQRGGRLVGENHLG